NDLGYSRGTTTFYTTYLQSTYVVDNAGEILNGLDVMAGLDLDVTSDLYPDGFTVGAEGTEIFHWQGGSNSGGILVDRNGYRAVYTSFDFQNLTDTTARAELVTRILDEIGVADVPWFGTSITTGTVPPGGTLDWT